MRTPPPDVDEARTLPAPVLIAASVQPVLSGTVVEDESNHEILDAIDHAHQQLIAAEIAATTSPGTLPSDAVDAPLDDCALPAAAGVAETVLATACGAKKR